MGGQNWRLSLSLTHSLSLSLSLSLLSACVLTRVCVRAYECVRECVCVRACVQEALVQLQRIKARGLVPTNFTYSLLALASHEAGDADLAADFLRLAGGPHQEGVH